MVLVLLGCFWPGNDSSGPNQSFKALATALGDRFEFRLVARDRPTGPARPRRRATTAGSISASRRRAIAPIGALRRARACDRSCNQTPHDVLWLNSVFDREFSLPALAMRRLGWIEAEPTLLSPRGEFGVGRARPEVGARSASFSRRRVGCDLWRGVTLHATSEAEARDMAAGVPGASPIVVAPNIRLPIDAASFAPSRGRRLAAELSSAASCR